jgi:hypothetical protein
LNVESIDISQLKDALSSVNQDVVLSLGNIQPAQARLLVGTSPSQTVNNNTQVQSQIFNSINNWSLSGLWVALFLLIMLGIALNCLFSLKTNDRFARQNLWVGRES